MTEQEKREYQVLVLCNQSFIMTALAFAVPKELSDQLMAQSERTIVFGERVFNDLMIDKSKTDG